MAGTASQAEISAPASLTSRTVLVDEMQPATSVRVLDTRTPTKIASQQAPPRRLVRHKKKTRRAAPNTPRQIARQLLAQHGWSGQFSCLDPLWEHESGWQVSADNTYSGAYGIPQAEPGSQMASAGSDWQTDAATQIRWGLSYIKGRYGDPCGAWSHEEAYGWY